ncbi:MAG: hypothetical protein ACW99G_06055 [Candidatus Thorarchaeota archaeon]
MKPKSETKTNKKFLNKMRETQVLKEDMIDTKETLILSEEEYLEYEKKKHNESLDSTK